jgi:hypothetical protein
MPVTAPAATEGHSAGVRADSFELHFFRFSAESLAVKELEQSLLCQAHPGSKAAFTLSRLLQ